MSSAHALLGPSAAVKWLNCTPSVRAEQEHGKSGSSYADEGNIAHDCAEIVATQRFLGQEAAAALAKRIHGKDHLFPKDLYDGDMMIAAVEYTAEIEKIISQLEMAGVPYLLTFERKVDISRWTVPGQFGTSDCRIVTPKKMWVLDFKYGKGVFVDIKDNEQVKLYALGVYDEVEFSHDTIEDIVIGIIQPRMNNTAYQDIKLADLLRWGEEFVKPRAELAWEGKGDFAPGPWCDKGFCALRRTCRARAEHNLRIAGELPGGPTLTTKEIADLLPRLGPIASWASGLLAYAEDAAVNNGVEFPGYKVVEGRSNRKIADQDDAAEQLIRNGFTFAQILKPRELLGLGDLEKVVGGKKRFEELLGKPGEEVDGVFRGVEMKKVLIVKPDGKPTLVTEEDPRPIWKPKGTANDDFAE